MRRNVRGPLAAAVIVAGCGLLPAIARADAPPRAGVVTAVPGDAEPLDLQACLRAALAANDHVVAERWGRRELDGQMKQALATGLPTLDLVGDWTRSRDPSFALDSTFGGGGGFGSVPGAEPWFDDWLAGFGSLIPPPQEIPAQSYWRASLNLNWTVNPVKVLGAVGAARLGLDRQEHAVRAVEQRVGEQVVAAFQQVVTASDRIAAVRAHLANQDEILAVIRLRYELGLATQLDTLQAAVGRANTVPALTRAEAGLRTAGARLNALLGRDPATPLSVLAETGLEDGRIDVPAALSLARSRPDLAAGGLLVDMQRRGRQATQADNLPYLTVNGAYGYVGRTTDSLFDEGHDSWRASVALNVPIFDGLLTRGLVREADGRIRRAEAELSAQRRDVEVEVLDLLARLESARQTLAAVAVNLARAEEARRQSLLQLELGTASYVDVLVAEANRSDAQASVIDARFEVLALTASLKRAIGRDPAERLADIPGLLAGE
jgi:outer membrane protein TolC